MKTIIAIFFYLSLCLQIYGNENDIIVFPDSFEIESEDGTPFISIYQTNKGIQASFRYKSSYKNITNELKSRLGNSYYKKNIIKVNILPKKIDFLSELFEKSGKIIINKQIDYDINSIYVQLLFNKDYNIEDIRRLILFPFSLGTADGNVICQGNIIFEPCGNDILRIPLMNQYATDTNTQINLYYQHYSFLRNFSSYKVISQEPFLSQSFADFISSHYFNKECKNIDTIYIQDACEIAYKYSKTGSIREAILFLAEEIFNNDFFSDNYAYFIFNGNSLNLKRINYQVNFDKIRKKLNTDFRITYKELSPDIEIPFVKAAIPVEQRSD